MVGFFWQLNTYSIKAPQASNQLPFQSFKRTAGSMAFGSQIYQSLCIQILFFFFGTTDYRYMHIHLWKKPNRQGCKCQHMPNVVPEMQPANLANASDHFYAQMWAVCTCIYSTSAAAYLAILKAEKCLESYEWLKTAMWESNPLVFLNVQIFPIKGRAKSICIHKCVLSVYNTHTHTHRII